MTVRMVRTGSGAAHPDSVARGSRGARGVRRVPGVLAGAVALLALVGGGGVAHGTGTHRVDAPSAGTHGADGHGAPSSAHEAASDTHGAAFGAHEARATDGLGDVPAGGGNPGRADQIVTPGGGLWMRAAGVFSPPGSYVPSGALTYDTALVPAGARIEVSQYADRTGTRVTARLRGLVPNRAYGMHVHTSPCGADPAAAGPHYQNRPSATADPVNEVWLDFRTDADGDGRAEARQDWGFREGGAWSVIIHDRQGGAGERAACFTVPFGSTGESGRGAV
ncbi:superoxide dismutase family protein [Streptomyces sp. NPDC049916]|uniref:superoxide dismutase family protein n=1 Tax=Streptomyces sp. NPDC049916 TaxID=3155156 RepID=UPI00343C430F